MKLLIHLKSGKKFIVREEKDFNTNFGLIKKEDLQKVNTIIKSHKGEEFFITEPSFVDLLKKVKKGPQTTHFKDIGFIIAYTGLSSGWKVVELGTGSGILTAYLANIVKPNGHVYSYEIRKEFYEIAKKNLEFLGLDKYVTLKLKDCREGIDEKNVDMVISDFRDPWNALDHIYNALKPGGFYVALFPNITSVYELLNKIKEYNFIIEFIGEVFYREWVFEEKVLRPKNMGLVHTEFILIFRKY